MDKEGYSRLCNRRERLELSVSTTSIKQKWERLEELEWDMDRTGESFITWIKMLVGSCPVTENWE